jgi:putative transposase
LAARTVPQILGQAFQTAAPTPRSPCHRRRTPRLIAQMAAVNPLWRAPRIHGELKMLGIAISKRTVSRILRKLRQPPNQTWRTFLRNHVGQTVSTDFFTVPTIRFQILYVFLVLAHDRRRILHFAVTAHPTVEWTVQRLREAFPWDTAPDYLLRDRDRIFGQDFVHQIKAMGIKEVLSAPRLPWQRAYVERVIGTIRRECLDHIIVFTERSLYRHLREFLDYYPNTFGIAEGHAGVSACPVGQRRAYRFDSGGRRSASSL